MANASHCGGWKRQYRLTVFTAQFPKPGETIFGQKFDLGFGGKGANQAVAAVCAAQTSLWWREWAATCSAGDIENFKKLGIDATHVKQVEGLSSGVAPIFVDRADRTAFLSSRGQ